VLGRWSGGFSRKIHLETDFHGWAGASIAVAKLRFGRGAPREARIAHLSATLTIAKKSGQIFRQGLILCDRRPSAKSGMSAFSHARPTGRRRCRGGVGRFMEYSI
jgi:hypothetical protein